MRDKVPLTPSCIGQHTDCRVVWARGEASEKAVLPFLGNIPERVSYRLSITNVARINLCTDPLDARSWRILMKTGKEVWKYEAQNYLNAAVAIEGNFAVFGGCDGLLHVVDILTGEAAAAIEIATYVAGAVALENGMAYTGDYDGMFSCVDVHNDHILWQFESRDRQLPFIGSASISGNHLIVGSRDRFIYCLDKSDGTLLWQRNTGSRVDASPLADSQQVLIANMRGDLMLLDQKNGDVIWTYELGSPVIGSPAFSDGLIIVGTQDGSIYALGKP